MHSLLKSFIKDLPGRFSSGIWLMMALDGLVTISFSIALPFLSLYLHVERGISMTLVGLIFLIGGLCSGITSIVGGTLSDKFGRRNLILIVSLVSIFTHILLGVLMIFHFPVWLISLTYIIVRSIVGILPPAIYAVVADLTPKDRLTESYALVRIGGNIGFAFGPALGGYLVGLLAYGFLFIIAGLTFLLVIYLVFYFLKESYPQKQEQGKTVCISFLAKDRVFLSFIVLNILLIISMAHMGSTLSIFTVDGLGFSTLQYGFLLTMNGILVVLIQYPVAFGVNKLRKEAGLVIGSLLYAFGFLTLGWFDSFREVIFTIVLITAGEVVFSPVASTVVAELAPIHQRGLYMGLFSLGQTIGFSLSPLFGGALLDSFSSEPVILWGIIAFSGLVTALGFYVWGHIMGRKKKPDRISEIP